MMSAGYRLLIIFMLLSGGYSSCLLANPCQLSFAGVPSEGIGGTGLKPIKDEGIGGTGHSPMEEGIGGTGRSDHQIKHKIALSTDALQVYGVVTGFASVCVNGFEVHLNNQSQIYMQDKLVSERDLKVGQIVSIQARNYSGRLIADSLNVQYEVIGKIAAIDADKGTATILNQNLTLNKNVAGLSASQVKPGMSVRVSGLRKNINEIYVTRLEPVSEPVTESFITRVFDNRLQVEPGRAVSIQAVVGKDSSLFGWPQLSVNIKDRMPSVETGDVVQITAMQQADGFAEVLSIQALQPDQLHVRAGYADIEHRIKEMDRKELHREGGHEPPKAMKYETHEQQEEPEYEKPDLPEEPEYEAPEYEAPEHESPELPEAPEYEAPELPEAPEYEAPELPEALEYEAPELPEAPEYEAPELPEAPEYEAPELPEAPEYEAPELPEALEYEAPELPEAPEYEAPELPELPET